MPSSGCFHTSQVWSTSARRNPHSSGEIAPACFCSRKAQSSTSPGRDPLPSGDLVLRVDPPSSRFVRFDHPADYFTIDYPDNWTAYPSGLAVSLAR